MSPASRSKSKDKKPGKEPPKGSSKPSGQVSTNGGIPSSGYNPLLGTFHTFEAPPVPSTSSLHVNSRFRNIDDTDDQNGNTSVTGVEYDSVSNNGSWSGESEDHKDKASRPTSRQDSVPGADNDKREKIRQKNERKHQRQKERRAQELHERCSGYLMSRKLEALAQQLVSMGFSHERATMALILNEGKVEESVAWLFEGGEEDKPMEHNLDSGGNLKIDLSEELARITDMESRYKASKQEVERAIVTFEGDLEKAEEMLKTQKQELPDIPSKPEETGDPPTIANGKLAIATSHNAMRVQAKPTSSSITLQKRDEKDFNYTKNPVTVGAPMDPGMKSMQVLKKIPPKIDWTKPQQIAGPADKRWPGSGPNPSASCSLASPLQASAPPVKMEARSLAVGNGLKNLQLGSVREPVIVMQRPQSVNSKQAPPTSSISSSPPGTAMGWYPNNVDVGKPNGLVPPRSISPGGVGSNLMYNPGHYQSQTQFSSMDPQGSTRGNGSWNKGGASPTLSAASSLGLFSGLGASGSSGSSSPVDWSTGSSMLQCDYTNIDWSLDPGPRLNGLWNGTNYSLQNNTTHTLDTFGYGMGVKSAIRPAVSGGNGASSIQEATEPNAAGSGGSWEWTSPFEERDLFSLPRQFVSSPTL
ncbi:hypothetical protein SASPL_129450 [Salvia splendens]|uniref:UBA domain-containing protein n=1 Tax=Salvia splendens TaxID=180675 RepID=A0A8X8XF10_SALSN|nr:uncharacterized protein LOC121751904 [Salvia splendens]KAG6411369.1 hypothetical protein SASPL_129450 [Salvia splendens]